MGETLQQGDSVPTALHSLLLALRRLLRPLVNLLLRYQVTYPFVSRLLKEVYVEVALADLSGEVDRPTDSRISLLTGVHRKEVRRLRSEPPDPAQVPEAVGLGSQVSTRWLTSPEYLDEAGHPKPLPRVSSRHDEPSFDRLVASVSKDIRSRSVLDEWLRLGVASVGPDGLVRLRVEGFVPEKGFEEKAFYFGRNLGEHINSAAHNLRGEGPPLFERAVYYKGLSEASVTELEELASRLSTEVLQQVNRKAVACKERDAGGDDQRFRVALGSFFFRGLWGQPGEPTDDED